jgi:hypothetical protein
MPKATKKNTTSRRTKIQKRQEVKRPASADPIFALIETHKKLYTEWAELSSQFSEAETIAKKQYGDPPSESVPWHKYSVRVENLEVTRAEVLKLPGADPTEIQTEYWNIKARLLGATPGAKEWDKNAGLTALRRDLDRALTAEKRAYWNLAYTHPTTPAGAGAFLDYFRTRMFEMGDERWHAYALGTLVTALAGMAQPIRESAGRKAA